MDCGESDLKIWTSFDFIISYVESLPLFFVGCLMILLIINNRFIPNVITDINFKFVYIISIIFPLILILFRNKLIKKLYKSSQYRLYNLSRSNLIYFLELIFFVFLFYIFDRLNYENLITLFYLDVVLGFLLLYVVFNIMVVNSLSEIGYIRIESLNLEKNIDKFDARQQWISKITTRICKYLLKGNIKIDKNELRYVLNIELINDKKQSVENINLLIKMFITKNVDKNNYNLLCSLLKKDYLPQYVEENKLDKIKKIQELIQVVKYIFVTITISILILTTIVTLTINNQNLINFLQTLTSLL